MKNRKKYSYNERLFSSGIRKRLHEARFHWLFNSLKMLNCQYSSVLELGCFDAKTIAYLPVRPSRYLGLDANWENGLDIARKRWKTNRDFEFRECHTPQDMALHHEKFDIAICMDTLEHVPPNLVEPYLAELSQATRHYLFISAPNEKGMVFLFKYVLKKMFIGDAQKYRIYELVNATLGKMDKVERKEHKGFDYELLLKSIAKYSHIYDVSGYPFKFLPVSLNFGIGIIGRQKLFQVVPSCK